MININKIKTYSLKKRKSKVKTEEFAKAPLKNKTFLAFYNSLPNILKAKDIRNLVDAIVRAHKRKKPVIFMAGAHVIKCGLSPVLIDLIKKRIINCLVFTGASLIHDFEVALQGATSEEVAEELRRGKFGMARETADFINRGIKQGVLEGEGLGYALAKRIANTKLPYKDLSVIYQAWRMKVPVCVFVGIGTDIIHQHPSFDAALTGEGSLRDFHTFVRVISRLGNAGVILNFGSAVILPEVFLKALNLARNLGFKVKDFTAANFDMIYHYRPAENLIRRPLLGGGQGYYIVGHHEIMFPFLAQAIIEKIRF